MPLTLADILNAPTTVRGPDGTEYQLREPTALERGMFQRWLEQRAREAAGRATDLPPDEHRQLLRDVNTDIAVGTFAWGGAACVQSLQTPDGTAKLYSFVLGVSPEKAADIIAHNQAECVAVIAAHMSGGTDEEKKGLRQMLVSLGLPADFLDGLNVNSSSNSATPPSTTAWITSEACPLLN